MNIQLFVLVQSKTIQGPGFPGNFYLFAFKVSLEIKRSKAVTLVPIAPPGGRRVQSQVQPFPREWFEVDKPRYREKPLKWSRCSERAEAFPIRPLPVVAVASLVTQLITLGLRRFIALHSNCTNAPDSQTAFMAALLRQRGGCPVIRDGIPARSKGCARQGRTMAARGNHKLQPLSLSLWPFWLSYMNANALRLAPINTAITTANMATLAKGDSSWRGFLKPISKMTVCAPGQTQAERKDSRIKYTWCNMLATINMTVTDKRWPISYLQRFSNKDFL